MRDGSPTAAIALAVAAGLALGLAGCGGSGARTDAAGPSRSTPATTRTTSSSARVAHSRRHHTRRVSGPRVGRRQGVHVGATSLTVRIVRVLRLTHTGSASPPGNRQVGVQLRIAVQSGATYDSTASGDVSLVLSSGESEPLDVRDGVCATPLVDFESFVTAGAVRDGCVAFSVPRGARVIGVRFSPHSRARGTLTWRTR